MIPTVILLMGERAPVVVDLCPMVGTLLIPAALVFGYVRSRRAAA